jgi:anti-sigma B factor antagonist
MERPLTLHVTVTSDDATVVVAFTGDLDLSVANEARARLDEAIDRAVAADIPRLVLDASALGFCDSTGLTIIVRAREFAAQRGVRFSVVGLSGPLRELLRLTGLDAILRDRDDE